jgi:flagellar FliL protein
MKMVILVLVAFVILGGGGGGAYYFLGIGQQASAASDSHGDAHDKKDSHGDDSHGSFEFVELAPLILPILDNGGVHQVVSVVIAIEVRDHKGAEKVKRLAPRLKDAYIQDLYGALNLYAARDGGAVQVGLIKKRLTIMTRQIIGEDLVNDVLLQVVQQRPV